MRGIASILERLFQRKKATAKLFNDAYFANLYRGIKTLHRSDPSTGAGVLRAGDFFSFHYRMQLLAGFVCFIVGFWMPAELWQFIIN